MGGRATPCCVPGVGIAAVVGVRGSGVWVAGGGVVPTPFGDACVGACLVAMFETERGRACFLLLVASGGRATPCCVLGVLCVVDVMCVPVC